MLRAASGACIEVIDDDAGAIRGQPNRERAPYPTPGIGNDRDFACKLAHADLPPEMATMATASMLLTSWSVVAEIFTLARRSPFSSKSSTICPLQVIVA